MEKIDEPSTSRKRTTDSPPDGDQSMSTDHTSPKKKARLSSRRTEEAHFRSLYSEMLENLQKNNKASSDAEVGKAIEEIISSFREGSFFRFSAICFWTCARICGYLFRYGAHGAGLARCKTLEAISHCEQLAAVCLQEDPKWFDVPLEVVSLGGGPGNDALGFCSALAAMGFPEGQKLSVTVVDAVGQWNACVELTKRLLKTRDLGDVSEMFRRDCVTMTFENAKLPASPMMHKACYDAIRSADVIIMSKLLSIIDWKDKTELIKNIHSNMKDRALLLFIDSPFNREYWHGFDVLYLSEAPDDVDRYQLLETHARFGAHDGVHSKARVAVLTKSKDFPE